MDFDTWLDGNLRNSSSNSPNTVSWNTIFASTIWHIWKMRNDFQFNDKEQSDNQVALKSINFARWVQDAFHKDNLNIHHSQPPLIRWVFPPAGFIKINTDGCCFNTNPSCGSFGGLARNEQGNWIEGFCGFIGGATPIQAELWAIRHALRLTKEKGWVAVILESDCQDAIDRITAEDEGENHPCRTLIQDCKNLIKEVSPKIQHVLREANRCADKLAQLGKNQHERLVKVLVPPMELLGDLKADMEGVAFPRGY